MFDVVSIIPPHPIKKYVYKCDSKFHTEPIEELFEDGKKKYGVIILQGDSAELFMYDEYKRSERLTIVKARIAKSHKRGGQSQRRIARLHDEQVHNYLTFVEEAIQKYYVKDGVTQIRQLILSGPGQKKEQLKDRLNLNCEIALQNYSNIMDIENRFEEIISSQERKFENLEISEIKNILELNPDRLVFGNEVDSALKKGELQKLWIDTDILLENKKTKIIVTNHPFIQDYGGKIGLKWY